MTRRNFFSLSRLVTSTAIGGILLFSQISFAQLSLPQQAAIVCNDDVTDAIKAVTEPLNPCLMGRIPGTTAEETLAQDNQRCACIRQSHLNDTITETANSLNVPTIRESIEYLNRYLVSLRNEMFMQSMALFSDPNQVNIGLNVFNGGSSVAVIETYIARTRESVTSSPGYRNLPPAEKVEVDRVLASLSVPELRPEIAYYNKIPPENSATQCVTYMEYFTHKQIPSDNDFYMAIRDLGTYNPEEWSIPSILTAMEGASPEESTKLAARLDFLHRNPIYNAIFSAAPNADVSAETIRQRQEGLFRIIKNLAPANASCARVPSGCWDQAIDNGTFDRFRTDSANFITTDPVVHDIVAASGSKSMDTRLNAFLNQQPVTERIQVGSSNEYFERFKQSSFETTCNSPNPPTSCYEDFSVRCDAIGTILASRPAQSSSQRAANVNVGTPSDRSKLMTMRFVNDVAGDSTSNVDFLSLNNDICTERYQNADGVSMNYFEYRRQRCEGQQRDPLCGNRAQMLGNFLMEFRSGGDDKGANYRRGFAHFLGAVEYADVTPEQIRTASRNRLTPREIRAQNGGRYPTITPSGQIVRPAGATSVASSSSKGGPSSGSTAQLSRGPASVGAASDLAAPKGRGFEPSSFRPTESSSPYSPTNPLRPTSTTFGRSEQSSPELARDQITPLERSQRSADPREPSSEDDQNRDDVPVRNGGGSGSSGISSAANVGGGGGSSLSGALSLGDARSSGLTRLARRSSAFDRALLDTKYSTTSQLITPRPSSAALAGLEAVAGPTRIEIDLSNEALLLMVMNPDRIQSDPEVLRLIQESNAPVVRIECVSVAGDREVFFVDKRAGGMIITRKPTVASGSMAISYDMNVTRDVYNYLRRAPSGLNTQPEVVDAIRRDPASVVRINVRHPEGRSDLSVYATKRNGTINFSILPP